MRQAKWRVWFGAYRTVEYFNPTGAKRMSIAQRRLDVTMTLERMSDYAISEIEMLVLGVTYPK